MDNILDINELRKKIQYKKQQEEMIDNPLYPIHERVVTAYINAVRIMRNPDQHTQDQREVTKSTLMLLHYFLTGDVLDTEKIIAFAEDIGV